MRNKMFGVDALVELKNGKMTAAINLDNSATTPPFKAVMQSIKNQLYYYGSIGRGKGQKSAHSTDIYANGREIVKDFVGASSDDYTVFYANSTTDGMNKLASALIENPNDVVITTRMEHHANDLPWRERCQVLHCEVDELGRLDLGHMAQLLSENAGNVKFVSVTAASNVTGYVNDVHTIAKMAHQAGAQIVVDGAQIVSHRAFHMIGSSPDEDIDYFVFSAHKMYSPFGGGAVIGRSNVLDNKIPTFYGGGMVSAVCDESVVYLPAPDAFEAGSPNYPGVVGMLKSMSILKCVGFDAIIEHEQTLLKRTIAGLSKIPHVTLYGDNSFICDRVGIIVFNVDGVVPEVVSQYLADYYAIATRHAAFCAHPYVRRLTNQQETTPTCTSPTGMIRVSFGIYNTEEDVDVLIQAVKCFVKKRDLYLDHNPMSHTTMVGTIPMDRG